MDRLTRDRKNNLQLCGNASISVLRSFESKTGKTWLLFSNVYYISISTCKILNRYHQDIFHEFRRKRERENDEILNRYHQDIFHEFRRKREREKDEILLLVLILFNFRIPLRIIRIRDVFPPRKILHYTRLLVKLLARCTHVYA